MSFKADPSLKGKTAQVVNARTNKVYGNGIALRSDGTANYYVEMGQTNVLRVVVTDATPVNGAMTGNVLAQSADFTITVTK